jgi:hypothetical protein
MIQASFYVLVFFVTNFFGWYLAIVLAIMKHQPSDMSLLMTNIFYPLGGLFNILVYTRPKVLSLRRKNPRQYSWFQAFVIVIRAGAVVPMVVVEEENSPSLPRESLVNLTSIDTPPVLILANVLSSGIISGNHSEPDDWNQVEERKYYMVERKYYGNLRLLDSSPSSLANALSSTDDPNSSSAGEGQRSDLSFISEMETIAEEPYEHK